MLTTVRMRLPVWPTQSPERTRSANAAIRSRTACTSGTTFSPSTTNSPSARHPQRHVADGAVLGDVDVLAGEHRVDPLAQAGRRGEVAQQRERLVGHPVLRVVERDPGRLGNEALASGRVGGEQVAKLDLRDLAVVALQRGPGLGGGRHRAGAYLRQASQTWRMTSRAMRPSRSSASDEQRTRPPSG